MISAEFPTLNLEETGKKIKSLRQGKGYTVEEIAMYMGFTGPQAVYKWEWGKSLPTVDNLYALSRLFGVTIDTILVSNDGYLFCSSVKAFPIEQKHSAGCALARMESVAVATVLAA